MYTKVVNCGNYNCIHQNKEDGICRMSTIAIDKEGKCVLFRPDSHKTIPLSSSNEMDEHTNMC